MALRFPVDCDSPRRRTEYCYRAQELLRLIHNGMGRWYKVGLTQSQWDKFPQKVKNRYPYKPQLAKDQWDDFTRLFEEFENKIIAPLLANRELLKQSTNWTVDVDNIVEE